MTDRWQKYSEETLTPGLLSELAAHCDEFLVHAVNVEGKTQGPDIDLVKLLASVGEIPVTYAGGVHDLADLDRIREESGGLLDVTVGSALDLFGGNLSLDELVSRC